MIGRRLPALLLELVLVVQAGFVAAVLPQAATPVLAAGECQVTATAGGGVLSACPGAETLDDFTGALQIGFEGLRGKDATSSLSVTSTPAGATVLLNGLASGTTPLESTVPAGTYLVRIEK